MDFRELLLFGIQALIWLIFIEAIVANLIAFGVGGLSSRHPVAKTLRALVDPILAPFRSLLPPGKTGGWDLSPMIAIFLLYVLKTFLV